MVGRGRRESEPALGRALVWAAITFAMAGAAGGTGYLVAAATGEASAGPPGASAPPRATPQLLRASEIYATGRRAGARSEQPRSLAEGRRQGRMLGRVEAGRMFRPGEVAYQRIFDAGARAALADLGFAGDGFYVVGVSRGGRRVRVSHGPLGPGQAYELCEGGMTMCVEGDR